MKAGKLCLLFSHSYVLCSSLVEALPQTQNDSSCFQCPLQPNRLQNLGAPSWDTAFELLDQGMAGGGTAPRGRWDRTHVLLSFPPPLSHLLLLTKERYAGTSFLAPSVCSRRTQSSNSSCAVFCLPWDVPQGINHPYLDRTNWTAGCRRSRLGRSPEEGEVWFRFLGFPSAPMILLLCFCGVGRSPPDLARHRMCLTLLLEASAAVSWSQMAAQPRGTASACVRHQSW